MKNVLRKVWGEVNGQLIERLTLTNEADESLVLTNWGATILSLTLKDRHGDNQDVCLGYEDLETYMHSDACLGATIGPYANRLAQAQIKDLDRIYHLDANEGSNTLHSGSAGFDHKIFQIETVNHDAVSFLYEAKDGEGGFPGHRRFRVSFSWNEAKELGIRYEMSTDQDTWVNLTNHSYWNLSGHQSASVLDQEVRVEASFYTPVDEFMIPTGEIRSIKEKDFDCQSLRSIASLVADGASLKGRGLDHNLILKRQIELGDLDFIKHRAQAELFSKATGLRMQILTTEPAIQVYMAGALTERQGKGGVKYGKYAGICFETQHYPDSPNQAHFPTTKLCKKESYFSETRMRFFCEA